MGFFKKISRDKFAQAAIELAVFGAILIFVIGSIIRVALSSSYQQNQTLKAMRFAFSKSLESAQANRADRNTTSVLYVEDRLSADFSRYGTVDRIPFIINAGGTMSSHLFLPVDFGEHKNLAIIDVFVNGQHFTFTVADFTAHTIDKGNSTGDEIARRKAHDWLPNCWEKICETPVAPPPDDIQAVLEYNEALKELEKCQCTNDPRAQGPDPMCVCTSVSNNKIKKTCGCRRFYTSVANGTTDYCSDVAPDSCPLDPAFPDNNERFDLQRDGFEPLKDPTTDELRKRFSWQWKAVKGTHEELVKLINKQTGQYPTLDVDSDLKEETVFNYRTDTNPQYGPVTKVSIMDYQKGDVNFTQDDTDGQNPIGLTQDFDIYTFVDGTYLQVKEGKAYNQESNIYVRSVSKKDQVDVVSRVFQLSNDTGRLCGNGRQRLPHAKNNRHPDYWANDVGEEITPGTGITGEPNANSNPDVEACNDCFSQANISKTCFDETSKKLYIRSRIKDTRGRKWIVDTGPLNDGL